jgi:hypothetical protein
MCSGDRLKTACSGESLVDVSCITVKRDQSNIMPLSSAIYLATFSGSHHTGIPNYQRRHEERL